MAELLTLEDDEIRTTWKQGPVGETDPKDADGTDGDADGTDGDADDDGTDADDDAADS